MKQLFILMSLMFLSGAADDKTSTSDLMADVQTFYDFGIHRTGSKVDMQTADWLESQLSQAGLTVSRQAWEVDQYVLKEARVGIKGQSLDAFPLWYSPATPAAGLSGKLIDLSDDQACSSCSSETIGLIRSGKDMTWWLEFRRNSFIADKLRALLVISPDRSGEGQIQAQNVLPTDVGTELPFPVLLLNANDQPVLRSQIGETVNVFLDAHIEKNTRASNIIGTINRGPEWVVVSTPYSGWFQCAGERGPGIALLFHLARWASESKSPYSFFFVANSGHELGYLGAIELHKSGLLPKPAETAAWLHLGASIATPVWHRGPEGLVPDKDISRGLLLMTDDSFKSLLTSAFSTIPALNPRSGELLGEIVNVKEHGYRGFGLVGGGNIHFHAEGDTPATVSASSLSAVGKALTDALGQLHSVH